MSSVTKIGEWEEERGRRPKVPVLVPVIVIADVQVDPKDHRNCFVGDWDSVKEPRTRCPGIGFDLNTKELRCVYFQDPRKYAPEERLLWRADGTPAKRGQQEPVRRCAACIKGERFLKNSPHIL